jgi:hypothetical protein
MNNPFLPINETVSHDQAAEILTAGVSVYERGYTKHEALWTYWHDAISQQVSGHKRHKGLREDVHALLAQAGNPQPKSADFLTLRKAFRDTFPKPVLLVLSDIGVQISATQQCIKNWEAKAPSAERDRVIAANKAGLAENFAAHAALLPLATSIVGDFTVGRRCNWKSILRGWYDGPITLLSGNGAG